MKAANENGDWLIIADTFRNRFGATHPEIP